MNAFNAWPVAQTPIDLKRNGESQMLRLWRAELLPGSVQSDAAPGTVISCTKQGIDIATGDGVLRVTQLQLPGKKPMDAPAFVNANDISGLQLG